MHLYWAYIGSGKYLLHRSAQIACRYIKMAEMSFFCGNNSEYPHSDVKGDDSHKKTPKKILICQADSLFKLIAPIQIAVLNGFRDMIDLEILL